MLEIFKKYWFVCIVSFILCGFVVFFIYDTNKDKVLGKKVDGKEVVASVADANITADDMYNDLYQSIGNDLLYSSFERLVANAAIKTTNELEKEAKKIADTSYANIQSSYGNSTDAFISQQLNSLGYKGVEDFETYWLDYLKIQEITKAYYEKDIDKYINTLIQEQKGRLVSHILVTMSDSDNPTEEELEKVKKVEKALADGTSFEETAKKYSDDGSAANGGNLGYVDKNTNFVTEFLNASLAAETGKITDWIKTDYGWHKILVTSTSAEDMKKDESLRDSIYQGIESSNPTLRYTIMWEKAKELKIEFPDESIKEQLLKIMEIEE